MIRILQSVNIMDRAGLETMLMNYYRHMDRTKIQFDFLTHRPNEGAYESEIASMGGKVFHAPRLYPKNYKIYFEYMTDFFCNHPEYRIIHSHIDTMSAFPLYAAKKSNIPVRIAHSHSSKLDRDVKLPIKYAALKAIPKVTTDMFACGDVAGKFMFKDRPFKIIHNAIELDKFAFDSNIRTEMKKQLGIDNGFVIGHVGRYCYIKNQLFLLDVFSEFLKKEPNSYLLLIGKGEDEQKIRRKIRSSGLNNRVRLLIDRSDVERLYQVFDVFVMPSLFEGLPVVGVEAQANGLPCLVSDKISKEVLLTSNIEMMSLKNSASEWANKLFSMQMERNMHAKQELENKGYDVVQEAKKLQEWYIENYK